MIYVKLGNKLCSLLVINLILSVLRIRFMIWVIMLILVCLSKWMIYGVEWKSS